MYISKTQNQFFGCQDKAMNLDIIDVNPRADCVIGGNKEVLIVLGENVDKTEVDPVFLVFANGCRREDLEKQIVQPTKEQWGPSQLLSFKTPPQPYLEYLQNLEGNISLKLTIKDPRGHLSQNMVDFIYNNHRVGAGTYNGVKCIHCSGLLD